MKPLISSPVGHGTSRNPGQIEMACPPRTDVHSSGRGEGAPPGPLIRIFLSERLHRTSFLRLSSTVPPRPSKALKPSSHGGMRAMSHMIHSKKVCMV
ncbi:hypothetical protein BDW72DRAFT_169624 [Aspergillus terricola var. indicus]